MRRCIGFLAPVHQRATRRRSPRAEKQMASAQRKSTVLPLVRRLAVTSMPAGKGCAPICSSMVRSAPATASSGHPLPMADAAALSPSNDRSSKDLIVAR